VNSADGRDDDYGDLVTSARPGRPDDVSASVPKVLRVSAALSWRLLVVAGAVGLMSWIVSYLAVVIIPVAIALLLSALLAPAVARLVRWRVPRGVATAVVVIGGIVLVGGVLYGVITAFIGGLPDLQTQVVNSVNAITGWLEHGPLQISHIQPYNLPTQIINLIKDNQLTITNSALSTAATLTELLTGILLVLFTTIFFLHDGAGIWTFLIKIVPADVRPRVDVAGRRGFSSLVRYVRATAAVAVVDAVGIGIGLTIVGVPLAVPLAALVFLGAFIPIIGAVIAGTVAVLVALVAKSFVAALIVLAIVIAVMQLESHILQPLLLGRAVQLHPLAVVLMIAAGFTFGGIAGALMSVPILAVLNSGIRSLLHDQGIEPSDVDPVRPPKTEPGHK
jgi:putative heme transporter